MAETKIIEIKKRGGGESIIIESFICYGDKADEASVYLEELRLISLDAKQKQAEITGNKDFGLAHQAYIKGLEIEKLLKKTDLTEEETERAEVLKNEMRDLSKQLENSDILAVLKGDLPKNNLELEKRKDKVLLSYLKSSLEALENPIKYETLSKDYLLSNKAKINLIEGFLSEPENDWASFLGLIK